MRITYHVTEALAGLPARAFLQKKAGISLNLWRKIKRSASFEQNGQAVNPALTIVQTGDLISYDLQEHSAIEPVHLPLDIRYEDDTLLIVNKPANMLVHPTTKEHENTLANAVLYHYNETHQSLAFHPVHRLDRQTSGLVLIAKLPQIQHLLSTAQGKLFHRNYLALIPGRLTPAFGTIDAPIARKPGSIIERIVDAGGRPAITHYKTLKATDALSLLSLTLETGRTHQIRVHLAHLGHPLLGDDLYGGNHGLIERQALHACQMSFCHPLTQQEITIAAELPEDMARIVSSFFV